MVTNIPSPLRGEGVLQEYFEYYMARITAKPPPAPGLVAGIVSFMSRFMQANQQARSAKNADKAAEAGINEAHQGDREKNHEVIGIQKVVLVRKMTELTSLLERRDEVLKKLEEAHIQLAQTTLKTVAEWIEKKDQGRKTSTNFLHKVTQKRTAMRKSVDAAKAKGGDADVEIGIPDDDGEQEEKRMNELAQALHPYL
jgi:hypothetical protein